MKEEAWVTQASLLSCQYAAGRPLSLFCVLEKGKSCFAKHAAHKIAKQAAKKKQGHSKYIIFQG